jgi:putative transposase
MRQARRLAPWKDSLDRPVVYLCSSRVQDGLFVFGDREREQFRVLMRMQENFTGCRALTYCVMPNEILLLLEVPPMPAGGISDTELLRRIASLSPQQEEITSQALERARKAGGDAAIAEIHGRFTYRMHDLSEFMKTLLQRFVRWFNTSHLRSGTLWEDRYRSWVVEDEMEVRTLAAEVDLVPVRAGMLTDPADYRWSGYGEAISGGAKGNGKKAREGLVRACFGHEGVGFDAAKWREAQRVYRRLLKAGVDAGTD